MCARRKIRENLIFIAFMTFLSAQASAFEAWQIEEIFSNHDGSVQYIKLSTTSENQQNLAGQEIRALDAAGNPVQSFTFPTSLSGATANRSVLIGTAGFTSLTQLAVDYPLPDAFLPLGGGTVQMPAIDSLAYQRTQLPRNGTQALRSDGSVVTASPVNFAGQAGSVAATVLAEFDGATTVLNMPVVDVPGMGIVNVSMQLTDDNPIEFTLGDAYVYQAGATAGDHAARFQDSGVLHIPGAIVGAEIYEVNMTLINQSPIMFGNLQVLSVRPLTPPVDPAPDPLAASIAAGRTIFAQVCATCHGPSGGGTAQAPSLASASMQPFASLRQFIHDNMPFGNPGACVDSASSSCATDVSNYIRSGFDAGTVTVNY